VVVATLLIPVIYFDTPSVKVGLQQHHCGRGEIRRQQVGGFAIMLAPLLAGPIAHRGYDQQADLPFLSASLPVKLGQFLLTDFSHRKKSRLSANELWNPHAGPLRE